MLINICTRTLVQKCAISELIANACKQLWTWIELHTQTTKLFFQNFSKIGILPSKIKQSSKYSQCSFSILPEQNQFNLSQLICFFQFDLKNFEKVLYHKTFEINNGYSQAEENNHHHVSQDFLLMINSPFEQFLQSLRIHILVQTKLFFLQLYCKDSYLFFTFWNT